MSLIEVKDIYKIYNPGENEVRALDGINLTIERGEFVAIVGQSGSGKSTLMNMLGLLDVPTSGEYYLDGENVSHMTDDQLIRNTQQTNRPYFPRAQPHFKPYRTSKRRASACLQRYATRRTPQTL